MPAVDTDELVHMHMQQPEHDTQLMRLLDGIGEATQHLREIKLSLPTHTTEHMTAKGIQRVAQLTALTALSIKHETCAGISTLSD